MRITIVGSRIAGWELVADGEWEPMCVVENVDFDEAIDVFAANFPELMAQLDEFKCDEFLGNGMKPKEKRQRSTWQKKRGSGARFRELMMQGKTNDECLKIVREEFPDSKATLSDAAWNRALLRKNPLAFRPDGTKV